VSETIEYSVPGLHCEHCIASVTEEVSEVGGVEGVAVDLERKRVTVTGSRLDEARIRAAIADAGYEVA
jgi:copper chaperone